MGDRDADALHFEPTVFGAVRRYRFMVLAVVLAAVAVAVGLTLAQPESFRAQATLTVPQPLSSQDQASDQYLASQVLLLKSPEVADRAARIANGSLGRKVLDPGDFKGAGSSVEVIPPTATTPGAYGSTIITVAFTWPAAKVAQVGVNALLQAFDDVRADTIIAQGEATVAGIEKAILDARTRGQLSDLTNQRTEALVNQEMDLARHPTVESASEPGVPINGNVKKSGLTGLLIGAVVGSALAFARASRRRCFGDQFQPAELYGAPLIGDLPASGARCRLAMTDAPRSAAAEAFRFTAGSIQRIRAARGRSLSLAFVSTAAGAARSAVVANLALALAESGTRVLAVDADPSGDLTALLLPDTPDVDGLEQVLAGQRAAADCIVPSPLQTKVAVLGSGATTAPTMTGTAYFKAVRRVLVEAKAGYELVLVDSPALLQVAVATELVDASDAVVVVMGPRDPVRDHLDVLARFDLIEAEVVGYIHGRAPLRRLRRRLRVRRPPAGSLRPRRASPSRFRPAAAAVFEGVPSMQDEGHPSPAHGARR